MRSDTTVNTGGVFGALQQLSANAVSIRAVNMLLERFSYLFAQFHTASM